ncbi:hypothetical protein ACN38_g6176 [Penicillium nordicum]|uniref:Uncharacterized protein n=1 Tax=Penicillium nordicum TaxID=229535 RepID=A0A0M8P3S8_9EURO|nr:hypothetical protein ACN38_g6176 [Penicillium nordicum]
MKVIDPQTAVLTNVEVLAYLTSNPPRRPPPSSGNWAPSPDLRDHNTVVKEVRTPIWSLSSTHGLLWPSKTAPHVPACSGVDQTPNSETRHQETPTIEEKKNNQLTLPDSQLCKPSLSPSPTIPPLHSPPFLLPVEITIASRNDRHTANLKFSKYRHRC